MMGRDGDGWIWLEVVTGWGEYGVILLSGLSREEKGGYVYCKNVLGFFFVWA